jgi:hypothetical protein
VGVAAGSGEGVLVGGGGTTAVGTIATSGGASTYSLDTHPVLPSCFTFSQSPPGFWPMTVATSPCCNWPMIAYPSLGPVRRFRALAITIALIGAGVGVEVLVGGSVTGVSVGGTRVLVGGIGVAVDVDAATVPGGVVTVAGIGGVGNTTGINATIMATMPPPPTQAAVRGTITNCSHHLQPFSGSLSVLLDISGLQPNDSSLSTCTVEVTGIRVFTIPGYLIEAIQAARSSPSQHPAQLVRLAGPGLYHCYSNRLDSPPRHGQQAGSGDRSARHDLDGLMALRRIDLVYT